MARTVEVILDAKTGSYVRNVAAAEKANARFTGSTEKLGRGVDTNFSKLGKATSWVNKNADDLNRLAGGMATFGVAVVGALGLAGKAAMDWESAWAGVTKTVDGSQQQLAGLEESLRQMARTMPATHAEIAAVAEAAGQLGVATGDVDEFTKIMIDLGETTNLTADEAATSLAQFMNVMGTAAEDVDNLGATIVDLGNNGASTEKDIVSMAQRIAGAGKQVGLSEQDVLAFSNALASVGIRAEAGGTAISTSMLRIDGAVREAGDGLDVLAETAGMSSSEFAKAWETDAAGALNSFIAGLGKVQASGGDTNAILKQLGITGIRESDALRRLANAGGLLGESLDRSGEAWKQNSALAIEAAKRYETTESQMRIAWNNIKDAGIDAGAALLPMISSLADGAVSIAEAFGKIPAPITGALAKIGAVAGVTALAGAGLIRAATSGAELLTSFRNLQSSSPKTATAIGRVGKAAGIAAAALAGLQIAGAIGQAVQGEFNPSISEAARLMSNLASEAPNAGAALDKAFSFDGSYTIRSVDGVVDAIGRYENAWLRVDRAVGNFVGMDTQLSKIDKQFQAVDQSLVAMAQGGSLDLAQEGFDKLATKMERQGRSAQELIPHFQGYQNELKRTADELGVTNLTQQDYVRWMRGKVPEAVKQAQQANERYSPSIKAVRRNLNQVGGSAEDAAQELDDLVDSMFDVQQQALKSSNAALAFEQALDDAHKEARRGKKTLNIHTQAGRDNRRALDEIASSAHSLIQEQTRQGKSTKEVTQTTKRARKEFIETAIEMGATRKQAERLADKYGLIPKDVKTKIDAPGMGQTQREIDRLRKKYEGIKSRTVDLDFKITQDGNHISYGDGTFSAGKGQKKYTYATGGHVVGPGSGTSDSIPAWLSNGEFVVREAMTRKHRSLLEAINADQIPRFRDGGHVQTQDFKINTHIDPKAVTAMSNVLTETQQGIIQGMSDAVNSMIWSGGLRLGSDRKVSWKGGTFTENFANHLKLVNQRRPFDVYQGGWRPATSYSGTSHAGDAVDTTKPDAKLVKLMRMVGIAYWDRTGKGNWVAHGHGVPLPGAGKAGGSGVWQAKDYQSGGDGLGGRDYHPNPGVNLGFFGVTAKGGGAKWSGGGALGLSREQLNNAATIISVARSLGFGNRGAMIGLMTAFVESGLRNVNYGDRDSLGLFQQRRQGWAPASVRLNPAAAARMFFLGGQDGAPGLRSKNWQGMSMGAAAQAVQVSAFPGRYAAYADEARALVSRFATGGHVKGPGTGTSDSIPARLSNGEYVVKASAVRRLGVDFLDALNGADMLQFAAGGRVGRPDYGPARGFNQAAVIQLIRELSNPTAELRKFTKALYDARGEEKRNAEKIRESRQNLIQAQQELAQSARSVADQFSNAYLSESGGVGSWIRSMSTGAQDLTEFNRQVALLRKRGLSETLIQQIIGTGQSDLQGGIDLARSITGGGKGAVDRLNDASKNLQKAADALGYRAATGAVRRASGGYVFGPGTATSDSIPALLSNGEYVVNAHAARGNRALLDMINNGSHFRRFAGGGSVQQSPAQIGTPIVHVSIQDPFNGQVRRVMAEVTHTEMRRTAREARTAR